MPPKPCTYSIPEMSLLLGGGGVRKRGYLIVKVLYGFLGRHLGCESGSQIVNSLSCNKYTYEILDEEDIG